MSAAAPTPALALYLHARLAPLLGVPLGLRDAGALAQALAAASAPSGDLFAALAAAAGALARRRPFAGGNRALAAALVGVMLRALDLDLMLEVAEMPTLAALLDQGDEAALANWLRSHTGPLPAP